MGYHVNSCKIATIFKASIFCALFWLCFILDWDGVAWQNALCKILCVTWKFLLRAWERDLTPIG